MSKMPLYKCTFKAIVVSCTGKCTKPDNSLQHSYLVGQGRNVNCFFSQGLKKHADFSVAPQFPYKILTLGCS
jgi:hypothetical protein